MDWKMRFQLICQVEIALQKALSYSEEKEKPRLKTLLDNIREGKQWYIDNYPAEQYLLDNPLFNL